MMDLFSKGSANVLLGHLFTGSGLVSDKCLDAALKLQELVRTGKLSSEQAVLALKRASELGGFLDEDIIAWAKDPDSAQRKTGKAATGTVSKPASSQSRESVTAQAARDSVTVQRIIDLLKQAGLVSDEDLETAKRVKSRHGGEISQILISAGKLSEKTVAAAAEAQNLVVVGRLRVDKAIMALHYCERMRVGLKEAMNELDIEAS